MSVECIPPSIFFKLSWSRGMSMKMRKTAKTEAVTFLGRCIAFVGTTDIIRYNKLNIAVTNKYVRSVDIYGS